MADIDELIDEALAAKETKQEKSPDNSNSVEVADSTVSSDKDSIDAKKPEEDKTTVPVYRRVKKHDKNPVPEPEKTPIPANPPESVSVSISEPPVEDAPIPEEKKETAEELRARLKQKIRSKRQDMIRNRSSKKEKAKIGALTPIFYCDGEQCRKISRSDGKCCPTCRCFFYCSAECQRADWVNHKDMCGKNATAEGIAKREIYIKARDAAEAIFQKTKTGDYITVMKEPAEAAMPACLFASVAEKSNVPYWKTYLQNAIFTTTKPDTIGTLAFKLQAAMDAFPDKRVYLVSVLLDRIRNEKSSECVLRLFISNGYGGTMDNPTNGTVTKQVMKYVRKTK